MPAKILTITELRHLSPDPTHWERTEEIAFPFRFHVLEGNEEALWAEYKTPAAPFLIGVDLYGPGFTCSCPSRKFPCKHSLAVMLIYLRSPEVFKFGHTVPDKIDSWLKKRRKKTEAATVSSKTDNPEDGEIAEISATIRTPSDERQEDMRAGMRELSRWLEDTCAQGIAQLHTQPEAFFQGFAQRMVDLRLPGIGAVIRRLAFLQGTDVNWPEKTGLVLAHLELAHKSFDRFPNLNSNQQADLLNFLGVYQKKEEVMTGVRVDDTWSLLSIREKEEENNLRSRKIWLQGATTRRFALLLDYTFGSQGFMETYLVPGVMEASLFFYKSSFPIRALIHNHTRNPHLLPVIQGYSTIEEFMTAYAHGLAANPWLIIMPCCLDSVIPVTHKGQCAFIDSNGQFLTGIWTEAQKQIVLTASGGKALSVFGEWDGNNLLILAIMEGERYMAL